MSTQIARAFLDAYINKHPQAEVTELNVWAADLPPFDGEMAFVTSISDCCKTVLCNS